MSNPIDLYKEYFIDRNFERLELFQLLLEKYDINKVLYPGSFVHITPSFVFPIVTYVDSDKNARKFFSYPELNTFVDKHKSYPQDSTMTFYAEDYTKFNAEPDQSYDLLISQYAGFISQHCKRYLKIGGILLVNNSHGDASMAYIDDDYEFQAVVIHRNERYRISDQNLDSYFVPKKPIELTKAYLEQIQKGIGYTKTASSYLFKRVR